MEFVNAIKILWLCFLEFILSAVSIYHVKDERIACA